MNAEIVTQVFALSDERDQWQKLALDLARDSYLDGYRDGRADQAAGDDAAWAAKVPPRPRDESTFAELELLRWGPGGRESFGDPRPGDFTGGAL